MAKLTAHLLRGLAICYRRFPRQSAHERGREIRRWSRQLMAILHVRVRCVNEPADWPERTMLIANHVSWLDIFALLSVTPCVFVAKSEIRAWPLIGRLVTMVGTLYIERGKKSHARHMNEAIIGALRAGTIVAFCPEGTTTDGTRLLKFHRALFQPAIDADAILQPVALRYVDMKGAPTLAAAYVDDMTLVDSIVSIASQPRMSVELHFTRPVPTTGLDRRALADTTHGLVSEALGLHTSHTAPERSPDRPVALQ